MRESLIVMPVEQKLKLWKELCLFGMDHFLVLAVEELNHTSLFIAQPVILNHLQEPLGI